MLQIKSFKWLFLCFSNKVKLSGFLTRRKFREENKKSGKHKSKKSGRRKSAEWAPTILLQIRGGGRDFFYTKRCYCESKSQAEFPLYKTPSQTSFRWQSRKESNFIFFKPDKNKKVKSRIRLTRFEVPKISKFCKT